MPLTRERPHTPAFPLPAPLPSLSDALARRAAIFGPVEVDEAAAVRRSVLARMGIALRQAADLFDPARASA